MLYGYPMTADNGYFLYYDKSVLSEEDVQTLDGILAKANEAGKKVFMDVSNGWYIASFFLGAGCTLGLDENGKRPAISTTKPASPRAKPSAPSRRIPPS